jgi:predicted lipid carrier protein YhbT
MPSVSTPFFPPLLALPLSRLPPAMPASAFALLLENLFAAPLREGELDFLRDRVLQVEVMDARLRFALTLDTGRLRVAGAGRAVDLRIAGTVYDFLLLASRREDADTLFFKRRLRLEGDTELGLHLKNFLDSVEPDAQFTWLFRALDRAVAGYERLGRWQARLPPLPGLKYLP